MTPEQRAAQIASEWYVHRSGDTKFFDHNMSADFVQKQVAAAIRSAAQDTPRTISP